VKHLSEEEILKLAFEKEIWDYKLSPK
jgi:hypothetical protein